MERTLAVLLALGVGLFMLSSCSAQPSVEPPVLGDQSPSADGSAPGESASSDPSADAGVRAVFDDRGHVALLGGVRTSSAEQQAVVDAWMAYWQVRMDAFSVPEADPTAIGEVASGDAASQIVSYVRFLEGEDLRTEGDLLFDVSAVRVRGRSATLHSCVTNRSTDRRSDGEAAEPLTPFYEFAGHLARVGDTWLVTRVIDTGTGPC